MFTIKNRKKNSSGVAMIVAVIVGVVVMVFCLSLLLVAFTLYSQTSRQLANLQCKMLAQSFSESLAKEITDEDSDLAGYLKEEIQSGYWVSKEDAQGDLDGAPSGAVSELTLDLDDQNAIGQYQITVSLEYSLNDAEDDGETDGEEDDDQDQQEEEEGPSGTPDAGDMPGNGSYNITATIRCTKGNGNDRDKQMFVVVTEYPAVSFK